MGNSLVLLCSDRNAWNVLSSEISLDVASAGATSLSVLSTTHFVESQTRAYFKDLPTANSCVLIHNTMSMCAMEWEAGTYCCVASLLQDLRPHFAARGCVHAMSPRYCARHSVDWEKQ